MKLKRFLKTTDVSISSFARKTGINANTMLTYVNEKSEPTVTNAIKIIDATVGAVSLKDLKVRKKK